MEQLRLWHQSLTDLALLPTYEQSLVEHMRTVAPAGVQIDVHGVRAGTYPSRYPGSRIQQVYLQSLHKEQFVAAALNAESSGYDGMIIATIPDLALEECRSLVDIPVVGLGEASFKIASMLGDSIGVVSFDIDHLEPQLRRNARRYGVDAMLGPMTSAASSFDDVVDQLDDTGVRASTDVIDAVQEAARSLIAQGADVIVPGPGPMNLLTAKRGLTRVDEVPVVDSLRASVELCGMLARMRRAGTYVNRHGFYWARPSRDQLDSARASYGLDSAGDSSR